MIVREGKRYIRRDGHVVEMKERKVGDFASRVYPFSSVSPKYAYTREGTFHQDARHHSLDLVCECVPLYDLLTGATW